MDISERSFEEAIESSLLRYGPEARPSDDAPGVETPYGEGLPGGFQRRQPEDYDRSLCLIPRDVLDFLYATQPKEWERLKQQYGAEAKERLSKRLSSEIAQRGTLDVLRRGIRDAGAGSSSPTSGLQAASMRRCSGSISPTSSRWCANSTTARGTIRASTWCSS